MGEAKAKTGEQSEMPPYLVPPSPSRMAEVQKSNFPREELLSRDKIIRLVSQRQVQYEDTWGLRPLQEIGRARPSATAQRCLSMDGMVTVPYQEEEAWRRGRRF